VIFAAQHAAGRRQAEISDFSRVLDFYLGIDGIPDLLEKLRKLAEERQGEREEMAKSLDSFLQGLRGELSDLETRKTEIIKNPPWGKGSIPTRKETERKIDDLLGETSRLAEAVVPDGLSCQQKLSKIKELNAALAAGENKNLNSQLADLEASGKKAREVKTEWEELASRTDEGKKKINESEEREQELLNGQSLEDLMDELAAEEQAYDQADLRRKILSYAGTYFDKYHPSQCVVCDRRLPPRLFKPQPDDPEGDEAAARQYELSKKISEIKQLREELSGHRQSLDSSQECLSVLTLDAKTITSSTDPNLEDLDRYIEKLDNALKSTRDQIVNAKAEHDRRDKLIRDVETEERFHSYQEESAAIGKILKNDIDGPRRVLAEYDSFLATVDEVGRLVLESYEAQRDSAIPKVEEEISQVYKRLTAHLSYDGVAIMKQPHASDRVEPRNLELKVTSSRCPGQAFPPNVLNGQAARALQLVPYFVFSDYWHDVMELDLLLIDDPSESFDTSHLENLISVLHSVATHTQLVMASHEADRMMPLIKKYFPAEECCVVSVADFDPLKGPRLEQQ